MRPTHALTLLALIWIAGCGSKTGLDVPPLPPCTIDRSPAPLEPCEEWTLGTRQTLDDEDVWNVRATPHAGRAAVAYSVRSLLETRHEVRALVLDDDGRALGPPVTVVSADLTGGWLDADPSVAGGCELHVLGRLESHGPPPGWAVVDRAAGLGLIAADGYARTIGLAPDEDVWDLRSRDDELTWLAIRVRDTSGPLELVRADRRGRELDRTVLGHPGVLIGRTRRHMLDGGGFALVTADYDADETRASIFAANGELLENRMLSARTLGDAGSVEREGGWLAWSDRPPPTGLVLAEPDALHLARLRADGATAEIVSLELGAVRPTTSWAIAWRGGAYLVPVIDDERGYVGVFSETGAPLALLDFGARFEAAEIVATDRGAMVVASERRDPRFAATRLVARALTCVR